MNELNFKIPYEVNEYNWNNSFINNNQISVERLNILYRLDNLATKIFSPEVKKDIRIIGSFIYKDKPNDIDILINEEDHEKLYKFIEEYEKCNSTLKGKFLKLHVIAKKFDFSKLNYYYNENYALGLNGILYIYRIPAKYFKYSLFIRNIFIEENEYIAFSKDFNAAKNYEYQIRFRIGFVNIINSIKDNVKLILGDKILELIKAYNARISGGFLRELLKKELNQVYKINDVDIIIPSNNFYFMINDLKDNGFIEIERFQSEDMTTFKLSKNAEDNINNLYHIPKIILNLTTYKGKMPADAIIDFDYNINMLCYDGANLFDLYYINDINVIIDDFRYKCLKLNPRFSIRSVFRTIRRLGRFINEGYKISDSDLLKIKNDLIIHMNNTKEKLSDFDRLVIKKLFNDLTKGK